MQTNNTSMSCRYDFFGQAEAVIGQHSQPVRCVEHLKELGLVASGSWDNTMRLWDPRLPVGKNCVSLIPLPGKVFSMAQSGSRMVVGTSGRHVLIYDLRRYRLVMYYSHTSDGTTLLLCQPSRTALISRLTSFMICIHTVSVSSCDDTIYTICGEDLEAQDSTLEVDKQSMQQKKQL